MQRRKFLQNSSLAAAAFGNLPTTFMQPNPNPFVVKNGEARFGEKTMVTGSPNDIKISSKDTDGQLTVFEYTGTSKGGPPLHIHPNQDEIFFILDGSFKFQAGDKQHNLAAGDTIFLPRNVPHTFAQLTDKGKMFYFFTPSGKMEDFFRAFGNIKGQPSPQEGAKLFEQNDMKVVGPPLSF